ncbi:hypothetical protein ACQKPX_22920 [Photobacterium sp. DNB23_23_1]
MGDSNLLTLKAFGHQAQIRVKGAELISFSHANLRKNWIWQGSEWPCSAPILFPIIGNLKNGHYKYNGSKYSLPRHGFARHQEFQVVEKTDGTVTLSIIATNETKKHYPFNFNLNVTFKLNADGLMVSYKVKNLSSGRLWFSIGSHPGFNIDSNTEIQFESISQPFIGKDGFTQLNQYAGIPITQGSFQLESWDFSQGALYFKNLPAQRVHIKDSLYGKRIMEIPSTPYFALWKVPNADFICLEPWYGITSDGNFEDQIEDKRGIISLAENEEFYTHYRLLL